MNGKKETYLCIGLNKDKSDCKNKVSEKDTYCYRHKSQEGDKDNKIVKKDEDNKNNEIDKLMKMAFSVTYGECVETHAGMEQIGKTAKNGLSVEFLTSLSKKIKNSELIVLHDRLPEDLRKGNEAVVLLIRGGIEDLFGISLENWMKELYNMKLDKKALMRGKVVNKLARHNSVIADIDQEPDYEEGKGTVVNFTHLPLTNKVRDKMKEVFGEEVAGLYAELNLYYEPIKTCGIGFHGDTERRIVICYRLGYDNPIEFQWFHRFKPVGERIEILPKHGDIYLMSEKAVGTDWKKSSLFTLRHAAGASKYRTIKED